MFSKKWTILALVAAVTTGAFAASPASAEEAKYLVVSDTPEGIVQKVMTQSELDAIARCTLNAPDTPSCANGPVRRGFSASHGLALPIPSGFSSAAGTVPVHQMAFTSILSSATTARTFRCDVNENPLPSVSSGVGGTAGAIQFRCFAGSGSFPPIGAMMTQTAIGFATPSTNTASAQAGDQTALTIYTTTGGAVLIPGLGTVTAQLTY